MARGSDQRVREEVIGQGAEDYRPFCGGVIARRGACLLWSLRGCRVLGVGRVRLSGRPGFFRVGLTPGGWLFRLLLAAPAAPAAG
jgi:hypothetical protein